MIAHDEEAFCDGRCFMRMKIAVQEQLGSRGLSHYQSSESYRNYHHPVPCGLCRKTSEVNDSKVLFMHLNEHFQQLALNEDNWCPHCDMHLTHKADLDHYSQRAQTGDCGFAFAHAISCTRHHPPTTPSSALGSFLRQNVDKDRFGFWSILDSWCINVPRLQ